MKTDFKPSFERHVKKITDTVLLESIEQAILSVEEAVAPRYIPNLRKMVGFKPPIFYRIKIGDWRIGVAITGDLVTFLQCGHRKDFYRFFP